MICITIRNMFQMSDFTVLYVFVFIVLLVIIYFYILTLELSGLHKRYVLITGCDSGFGNMLAKKLDKKGVHVIAGCLTSQGADNLQTETSSRLKTFMVDVTDEHSVEKAVDFVQDTIPAGGLWGLVNNAGIMPTFGPIEWSSLKEFKSTCNVNLFGTVSMTMAFLPLLRASRGRLVNVCSVTANFGYPGITNYSVSKAGVKMFTACVRRELWNSGVTAHTIEPGGFNTPLTSQNRLWDLYISAYRHATPEARNFYGGHISKYVMYGLDLTSKYVSMKPEKVVNAMTHALLAKYPKRRYLVGVDAHMFFRLMTTLPEWISDCIIGWPKPYGQLRPELEHIR